MDIDGKQNKLVSFINCSHANSCIQLHKGKIYGCCISAYIKHFNKFFNKNLKVSDKDGIDIYKVKNINQVMEFLSKPYPFCRYCNAKNQVIGLKWKTSDRKIEEWI